MAEQSSPKYWFGPYDHERFAAIRQVLNKMSAVLTTKKKKIKLRCPTSKADACFTGSPSAHHIIKGTVRLCPKYFDRDSWEQARIMGHELLHHLFVKWTLNGKGRLNAVQDWHPHAHGPDCTSSSKSEKHYGIPRVRHLATYTNQHNEQCSHRNRTIRNNDTYAYFVNTIGEMVYSGQYKNEDLKLVKGNKLVSWPKPSEPTQKPPTECDFGTEGCQCLPTMAFGEGSMPDGDYLPNRYCPDHDGELSCVKTKFNASDTVGICTRCSTKRGPGCQCNHALPCDVGECYGDDTFGGGMGRCYLSPTPTWACLADCDRLFNDDLAYCYNDYPTGARCMDSYCTPDKAYSCYQQGKTCRYGDCVVECDSNEDCTTHGYPPSFICNHNRCEPS